MNSPCFMGCCDCEALVTLTAALCGTCYPTADYPVHVEISQTVGGTWTASCDIDSSAGCLLTFPAPCSGADFEFDVTWTSPEFVTQTSSVSVPVGLIHVVPATVVLPTLDGHWCSQAYDCFDAMPASLTVTISLKTPVGAGFCCDSQCLGTYSVPLTTPGPGTGGATYSDPSIPTSCVPPLGPPNYNIGISVGIGTGNFTCPGRADVLFSYTMCSGDTGLTLDYVSGTFFCPVAFTVKGTTVNGCEIEATVME